MSARFDRSAGFTLVELLVVIAILGIIGVVATVQPRRSITLPDVRPGLDAISGARMAALQSGKALTLIVSSGGAFLIATANPDGSVIVDSSLGVDYFTGIAREKY